VGSVILTLRRRAKNPSMTPICRQNLASVWRYDANLRRVYVNPPTQNGANLMP
jgi:hypothetical protein